MRPPFEDPLTHWLMVGKRADVLIVALLLLAAGLFVWGVFAR